MSRGFPTLPQIRKSLLVAFVGGFCALAPSLASASCGDWLGGTSGHGELPLAPLAGLSGAAEYQPIEGCRGPFCDRGPSERPGLPPVPVVESSPEHPACLLGSTRLRGKRRCSRAEMDDVTAARYVPFVPERPPRG